jgi:hypothetical protein
MRNKIQREMKESIKCLDCSVNRVAFDRFPFIMADPYSIILLDPASAIHPTFLSRPFPYPKKFPKITCTTRIGEQQGLHAAFMRVVSGKCHGR